MKDPDSPTIADTPVVPVVDQSAENVTRVLKYAGRDTALTPEVQAAFDSVVDNARDDLRAVCLALARRDASRLVPLQEVMEKLTNELMTPIRMETANNTELLRLLEHLQHQKREALDLIREYAKGPAVSVQISDNRTVNLFNNSDIAVNERSSREKVREYFASLMKEIPIALTDGTEPDPDDTKRS